MAGDYRVGLYTLSWIMGTVVIVVYGVRQYTKMFIIRQPGWDDALMGLAAMSALTCSALVTVATAAGLGRHITDIEDPTDAIIAVKYTFIAPTLSIIAAIFGKISIIIFMYRLMGVAAKTWHMIALCILCTIMIGVNFFAVVVMLGFCRPVQGIWDQSVDAVCWSTTLLLYAGEASTVYNAVMDVVITVIPIIALTKLNIQRSLKVTLCLLMGAGLFATIATICKAYAMRGITEAVDITWAWAPITLWYTAEMDAIIIFGSLPALLPAWRHAREWSSHHGSSGYNKESGNGFVESGGAGRSGSAADGGEHQPRRDRKPAPGLATKALFSIDNADSQLELTTVSATRPRTVITPDQAS